MSRRVQLCIVAGLAALCGAGLWYMLDNAVVPHIAKGTGPAGMNITPAGWFWTFAGAIGTAGFSFKTLTLFVAELSSMLPSGNPLKWILPAATNIGQIAIYRQAFAGAKTVGERNAIRDAANAAAESLLTELFPPELGA